ncbi:MAG: response regulator [Kiritimatiellae bacterium]|nr:response regulator [Kiritimatiellia bacterium]
MTEQKEILIVEDNEYVSMVMEKALKQYNFNVRLASDGRQARKLLKGGKSFDAILLDLYLPHVPGWELLDIIENNPEMKNTSVIIISSAGISSKAKTDLSQRVTAFVDKSSLNLESFKKLIEEFLLD